MFRCNSKNAVQALFKLGHWQKAYDSSCPIYSAQEFASSCPVQGFGRIHMRYESVGGLSPTSQLYLGITELFLINLRSNSSIE